MIALLNHALWAVPLLIAAALSACAFAGRHGGLTQHERDGGDHA